MAFTFLSKLDRQAWLASLDRTNPVLLEFAYRLDDLCETAREQTGRELPVEHAAAILLRDFAESGTDEDEEQLAA